MKDRNKASKIFIYIALCALSIMIMTFFSYKSGYLNKISIVSKNSKSTKNIIKKGTVKKNMETDVVLTSAGDCTIGTDPKLDESTSLITIVRNHNNDYSYLFKNAYNLFSKDDITTVNLESTFTNSNVKANKTYVFKAPPEFAEALKDGSIEGVNLANNHTMDYYEKGFKDTLESLKKYNISYFGLDNKWIKDVKGVKIGFLGYEGFEYNNEIKNKIKTDISELKNSGCAAVVINFHWGVERSYYPNSVQKALAHYAIDQGADLIVGHHPHVIQGIEQYKGKIISYSLGNFCFGGNSNPTDKETFVLQTKFYFKNGVLLKYNVRAVPFRISSVNSSNDYCPTPLNGSDKENVINKINSLSKGFGFNIKDSFN